ncbi:MAG: hypothetical protein MUF49_26120 [Oculatellaceae cyanobacterium Prado106]|jgi:hypothetical protein|nr:hypothetical protein [Oculatellaceae cyanobacterium Prado106]
MQEVLTFAFDFVLVTSSAYFSVGFVLGLVDRWNRIEVKSRTAVTPQAQRLALPEMTAIPVEAIPLEAVAQPEPLQMELQPEPLQRELE